MLQNASLSELLEIADQFGFATVTAGPKQVHETVRSSGAKELGRILAQHHAKVTYVDAYTKAFPNGNTPPQMQGDDSESALLESAVLTGATAVNVVHLSTRPTPWEGMVE